MQIQWVNDLCGGLEAGWHYPLSNYKDGQIYKEDSMRRLAS
jgi:hypothetical protein